MRQQKVDIIAYEVYRYVGQHRITIDEMFMGVSMAYDKLIKENYVARKEISDKVLRGKCTLEGENIE